MCVAAVAWRIDPRRSLVAIGNRDEYHARPAAPLAAWDEGRGILAGRDLVSGGTWLGVAPAQARFALVTNVRNPEGPDPAKASRGALVTDALAGDGSDADPAGFNPFNLLHSDVAGLHFVTNRPQPEHRLLPPGIYGLSNGRLDEPWPKTLALKAVLHDWLAAGNPDLAPLWQALQAQHLPAAGIGPVDGDVLPGDPARTPPFLRHPVYGTRCATVLAIDAAGHGTIAERRFDAEGRLEGETALAFDWG